MPKLKTEEIVDLPDADLIADEAVGPDAVAALAAEAEPPEKPGGTPDLVPYQSLARRQKAVLYRALGAMQDNSKTVVGLKGTKAKPAADDGTVSVTEAAALMDLMADAEDVVLAAAVSRDDAELWLTIASDADLMGLFSWYVSVMQPGEATPSSD